LRITDIVWKERVVRKLFEKHGVSFVRYLRRKKGMQV